MTKNEAQKIQPILMKFGSFNGPFSHHARKGNGHMPPLTHFEPGAAAPGELFSCQGARSHLQSVRKADFIWSFADLHRDTHLVFAQPASTFFTLLPAR